MMPRYRWKPDSIPGRAIAFLRERGEVDSVELSGFVGVPCGQLAAYLVCARLAGVICTRAIDLDGRRRLLWSLGAAPRAVPDRPRTASDDIVIDPPIVQRTVRAADCAPPATRLAGRSVFDWARGARKGEGVA